jgi:dTDP-glucose 4,6-dehydratase
MSKNILLTGGAGFIGSHTVEEILTQTDMNITIIDRLSYAGNLNRLAQMECWEKEKSRVKFVYHDFRSEFPFFVKRLIGATDYIIHMGAETHVGNSFTQPRLFAQSNVDGTINMLELAKDIGCEKFIYVGTDEVYGPVVGDQLHKEGEPHRPSNPYAASKSGAEAFVHSYWKSFNVPVVFTNTMNNFGERQDREKFIPKTIYNIVHDNPIEIHVAFEHGDVISDISSRCWLHARNHANALMFLLDHGTIGERYNVVGERMNVLEIALEIAKILGHPMHPQYIPFHSYSPGHDMHYGLDGTKMKELGWEPKLNLHDSLEKTVKWTLDHKDWL